MSNFILTQIADQYVSSNIDKLIAEYNSEEGQQLTQKGKRELMKDYLFFAFCAGYNIIVEQYVSEMDKRDKIIESLLAKSTKQGLKIAALYEQLEE